MFDNGIFDHLLSLLLRLKDRPARICKQSSLLVIRPALVQARAVSMSVSTSVVSPF